MNGHRTKALRRTARLLWKDSKLQQVFAYNFRRFFRQVKRAYMQSRPLRNAA